jgi:predicted phosphodiesterase
MPRIAVLSDIHGNLVALEAVLRVVNVHRVDEVYCLGDVFGYYPDGLDCLRMLDGIGCSLVMGNHEAMLTGQLSYTRQANDIHRISEDRARVPAKVLQRLAALPLDIRTTWGNRRTLLVHGHPSDPLGGYVFPDSELPPLPTGVEVCLCGNTHRGFVSEQEGRCVVNVGSVGMPRDRGDQAVFALVDTDPWRIGLVPVPLDTDAIRATYSSVHPLVLELLDRRSL